LKGGNMLRTILKLILGFVLLIAIQACVPGQPAPDLNAINTAVAQTLAAVTQTSEPGIPVTGDQTPTPTVTPVPVDESPTPLVTTSVPMETMTPIPLFTFTPAVTPSVPQISVSVPTNCRVGPGLVYDRVGGLQVGQVAEVVGRHAARDYWIIRNPNRAGETCWLWGQFATLAGDTSALPVFTPPPVPTPAPGFTASYDGLESCTGRGWWADIELENTGGLSFRSFFLNVRDTVTGTEFSMYADNFTNNDGCNESETRDNLPPGATRIVSSPVFTYDPTGNRLRATITLCSNPNQNGTCLTRAFLFTP
jgi:hypothetical protein